MPDKALIEKLADAFVAWPLPDSVCSDQCATMRDYKHRSGTNLLTVLEARQMFEYCLSKVQALDVKGKPRCEHCGSDRLWMEPLPCPRCGAPQCCIPCCEKGMLELVSPSDYSRAKADLEGGNEAS